MKKGIINWLKRNGFKRMEPNHYANDLCGISYNEDARQIVIADNSGHHDFIHHDIYSTIGFLTRHNFINRNYKD